MREHLTADQLFVEIQMQSRFHDSAVVVVEGPTDKSLYIEFFDLESPCIVPAYGKRSVIEAIRLCDDARSEHILGVVDSDSGDVDYWSANLVETGIRDADLMVLSRPEVVRSLICRWTKNLDAVPDVDSAGLELLRDSLDVAYVLGVLHQVNKVGGWGVKVSAIPVHEIFDPTTLSVDVEMAVRIACSKSPEAKVSPDEVLLTVRRFISAEAVPSYLICRGHDVAGVMAHIFNRRFGGSSKFGRDLVERVGRTAFRPEFLLDSELGSAIRKWELSSGVRILCDAA